MTNPKKPSEVSPALEIKSRDIDLFPEEMFSHLSDEARNQVKEVILGTGLDETEVDLLEEKEVSGK